MSVGVLQLSQAKRDQIETARAYVEACQSNWTARAEVEQLLAGRLPRVMSESRKLPTAPRVNKPRGPQPP
jgi:hypothetical protein